MPSRRLLHASDVHLSHHHLISVVAALSSLILCLVVVVLLLLFFRSRSRKTAPSSPTEKPPPPLPLSPLRFTFDQLRLATSDFHPSLKLGQGGFGPVFRGLLPLPPSPLPVAVKLMSSSSLQGDIEFRNELSLSSSLPASPSFLLLPLGFCEEDDDGEDPSASRRRKRRRRKRSSWRRRSPSWFDAFEDGNSDLGDEEEDCDGRARRRLLLVYDLMENGSLQDALLIRRSPEMMDWGRRFAVALDVARGIRFLHVDCDPPVVHGDVKPSNVLLDGGFHARLADFGLARVLEHGGGDGKEEGLDVAGEEPEEVSVGEEGAASPELSPMRLEVMSASETPGTPTTGGFDRASVESGTWRRTGSETGKDWWWKQDGDGGGGGGGGGVGQGGVKDYVMEWIGSEIRKERPPVNLWEAATTSVAGGAAKEVPSTTGKKRQNRTRDWWSFGNDERCKKKCKPRRPREWWREEFCEELTRKSKKKKQPVIVPKSNFHTIRAFIVSDKQWWRPQDGSRIPASSMKHSKKSFSRGRSCVEYRKDLRVSAKRSILDFHSGDIPKSGGVSSTPSMRGTVCYSAPECGGGTGGEFLSEKCDVYSFGVLLLVIVSGRRPLQVTASPMSEFERANLISWARNLGHRGGNLLDLVDPSMHGLNKEQALLCITVALLCLQRTPSRRPTITEVVEMLSGDLELPQFPVEFSPSPPCSFPCKSRRKDGR